MSGERLSTGALNSYWTESSRPLTSLLFVLPLLAIYEVGMISLQADQMRNGADVWLRHSLQHLGFSQYFLLPLLTCSVLLAWHHLRDEQWHANRRVLATMAVESLALAAALLVWAQGLSRFMQQCHIQWANAAARCAPIAQLPTRSPCALGVTEDKWGLAIGMLGAGIYEELLFRLMLIPLLITALKPLTSCGRTRLISAVVISSLLFSAAHYQWEIQLGNWHWIREFGDAFAWTTFLFRASAGLFFAGLFVTRGFGIAVGAHALYDLLVVWL